MKGRQKSLTAFLKATNLSWCLLADLLILLVMILYSSSLWFSNSLSRSLLFYSLSYPLEKEDTALLISLWKCPFPLKKLDETQTISTGWLFQQTFWLWFQHRWLLCVTVPFACLGQPCAPDPFAFSRTCSLGPWEISSLHPCVAFPCHSWCPEHFSSLISSQLSLFWIPTCTTLKWPMTLSVGASPVSYVISDLRKG